MFMSIKPADPKGLASSPSNLPTTHEVLSNNSTDTTGKGEPLKFVKIDMLAVVEGLVEEEVSEVVSEHKEEASVEGLAVVVADSVVVVEGTEAATAVEVDTVAAQVVLPEHMAGVVVVVEAMAHQLRNPRLPIHSQTTQLLEVSAVKPSTFAICLGLPATKT